MKRKEETMSIDEFMNRDFKHEKFDWERIAKKAAKTGVIMVGSYLILGFDVSHAASIDSVASSLYHNKFLLVGKWIIIIKGGFDTINSVVKSDFDSAKKQFLSYLVIYMILNALPWSMSQIDKIFADIKSA